MKGMACLDVVACKRNENENQDQKRNYKQTNKARIGEKGGNKHVEANKLAIEDLVLEHTSMKAWRVSGWKSLAA